MILVSNADGRVTYVSPEWAAFTGCEAAEAMGQSWLRCVHPDDHETTVALIRTVRDQRSEYSLRLRMHRVDGTYTWVTIGAVPSFGPPNRSFLGYLGSLTELGSGGSESAIAAGTLTRFIPPATHPATPPGTTLELVADHLLTAHGLVERDGAKELLPILRQALTVAGRLLASEMTVPNSRHRSH